MRILVLTATSVFPSSRADAAGVGLCGALREAGHEADLMRLPFEPEDGAGVLQQLAGMRLLELTGSADCVVTIGWPAHVVRHPRKVAWFVERPGDATPFRETAFAEVATTPSVAATVERAERRALAECTRVIVAPGSQLEGWCSGQRRETVLLAGVPDDATAWRVLVGQVTA